MVGSTLWVARPEIQQRYNLSAEVSQEVLDWLAAPPPPPVPIPTKGKRSSSESLLKGPIFMRKVLDTLFGAQLGLT